MPRAPVSRHARPESGSASRSVLLLAVLASAVVVALALLLRAKGPAPSPGGAVASSDAPSASSESRPSSAGAEGRGSLDAPVESAARGGGLAVGTRLAGAGRLEGRVVDGKSGSGVAGVRIELSPLPPIATTLAERILRLFGLGPELPEQVRPVASTLSVEGGAFAFTGVRPGFWFVDARGPYHAPESTLRARVLPSGAGGPIDVRVREGGRVLGRVLAPDGRPVRSAKVVLLGGPGRFLADALSGDLRLFEAGTDGDGAFEFDGVPPGGAYDLSAAGDRFAVSHAIDIDVLAGKDAHVDVHARAGGSVSGRVVESRGEDPAVPLAGAHVAAVPRGIRDLLLVGEVLAATHAVTAADGTFVLERVPPGEVDLAAVAPGHLPAIGAHVVVADGGTASAGDLALSTGNLVRGRTVDAAGAPIAGVQVRWNPVRGDPFSGGDFSFARVLTQALPGWLFPVSDAEGRFEASPLTGEPPWQLEFHKLGWKDANKSVGSSDPAGEVVVVLSRGGSVEGSVVEADSGKPVTSFTVSTSDAIDTEPGVPGAWNPFTGGRIFESADGKFRLDAVGSGKTTLSVASPGYAGEDVEVEVPEGGVARDVAVKLHPGGRVRGIVVDEDSNPVVGAHVVAVPEEEKGGGRARGRINGLFGGGDWMPPALLGYAVGLGLLGDREGISGPAGAFELTGVAAGALRVRAFHRDQAFGMSDVVRLEEGGVLENVRVEMHAGGSIEGQVRDRRGRPVASDVVLALAPMAMSGVAGSGAGGALYQGYSDAQGEYRIRHVAAGSYFLVVTRGDEALNPMSFLGRLNFESVTVPKGQVVHCDLVDSTSGGCRVHGTILDAGRPVPSGTLMAMGFEGGGTLGIDLKMAKVSSDGRYEFPGLSPGRWQLTLQDRDGEGGPSEIRMLLDVPDQAEYLADLVLPEGGIEGTVVDDSTGEPVGDAEVRARVLGAPKAKGLLALAINEDSGSRQTSDEEGRFAFQRLCAAEYEVVVRPPRGPSRGNGKHGTWAPPDPVVVRVDEGRVERGCVLRLSPPLSLAGIVRGEEGEAIEGARVSVRRQDRPESRPERAHTDANGRFEVEGLAPAVYVVVAGAKDRADAVLRDVKLERASATSSPVEVVLRRGVAVTVRVFQSDGSPAPGAHATLVRAGEGGELDTADADRLLEHLFQGEGAADAEGRIEMGRFLPGEYRLEVVRGGATTTRPHVTIRGDHGEVELRADLQ
jgi:hypothetical protein